MADHYLAKRKVPKENLVELDLPTGEDISRADYETKLAGPLRAALKDRKDRVRCCSPCTGCRCGSGRRCRPTAETAEAEKLQPRIEELQKEKGACRRNRGASWRS